MLRMICKSVLSSQLRSLRVLGSTAKDAFIEAIVAEINNYIWLYVRVTSCSGCECSCIAVLSG